MSTDRPARLLISQFKAKPCIQCAETGDFVISKIVNDKPRYWYVPAKAQGQDEFVSIQVKEIADGFFKQPINPFTWEKMEFKATK